MGLFIQSISHKSINSSILASNPSFPPFFQDFGPHKRRGRGGEGDNGCCLSPSCWRNITYYAYFWWNFSSVVCWGNFLLWSLFQSLFSLLLFHSLISLPLLSTTNNTHQKGHGNLCRWVCKAPKSHERSLRRGLSKGKKRGCSPPRNDGRLKKEGKNGKGGKRRRDYVSSSSGMKGKGKEGGNYATKKKGKK